MSGLASRAGRSCLNNEEHMAKAKKKGKGAPARQSRATSGGGRKRTEDRPPVRQRLKSVKPSGDKDDSFFGLVHAVARQIPKGRVTTYGAIAAALGTKLSARMVGWAMISAHAAIPPVPAHRVVNRNGLLSGRHHYSPPERMQELLEKEGVTIKDSIVVHFDELFWDPVKEL
jgi:methylated-DNA-protein-cysteine methyltransferase-like protein